MPKAIITIQDVEGGETSIQLKFDPEMDTWEGGSISPAQKLTVLILDSLLSGLSGLAGQEEEEAL